MTAFQSESPLARRVRALSIPRAAREAALRELALAERFAANAAELGQVVGAAINGLIPRARQGSAR